MHIIWHKQALPCNYYLRLWCLSKLIDKSKAIPPLYGALIKNEQDVQLLERLAFMSRR